MARLTTFKRRSRSKFPPEYAHSLDTNELFSGGGPGGGGSAGARPVLQWWQGQWRKELRGVVVCGKVHQRLCAVMPGHPD
jgi:hypothetical protein